MGKPTCYGSFESGETASARGCLSCRVGKNCVAQDAPATTPRTFEQEVRAVLDDLAAVLIAKNRKYGDSALNPKRVFSRASAVEQLKVRLDDKISRLMNQQSDEDEDVELDLMGYLVLLRIAKDRLG